MKKCFASGDHGWSQPWHIISTFYHIWHPFWHSFRHSIWHTFSHLSEILSDVYFDILFWHSIWHIFWSSIWHPVWDPIWHKFWHSTWHSTRHLWHYSDMFSGIVALSSGPSHSIQCLRYAVRVPWPTASGAGDAGPGMAGPLHPNIATWLGGEGGRGRRRRTRTGRRERERGGGVVPLLKSRDPHLAGGEAKYLLP